MLVTPVPFGPYGRGDSHAEQASELLYECQAGYAAFKRSPDLVAACFNDPGSIANAFIIQKAVSEEYLPAQSSPAAFLKADKRSNHSLLRQVVQAVHNFLDPRTDGISLVHDDLTIANIMWHPHSLALVVIDFSQVIFCRTLDRCGPQLLLKDIKKELIFLALCADFSGTSEEHVCCKRARRINFELPKAARTPADVYIFEVLGKMLASGNSILFLSRGIATFAKLAFGFSFVALLISWLACKHMLECVPTSMLFSRSRFYLSECRAGCNPKQQI